MQDFSAILTNETLLNNGKTGHEMIEYFWHISHINNFIRDKRHSSQADFQKPTV